MNSFTFSPENVCVQVPLRNRELTGISRGKFKSVLLGEAPKVVESPPPPNGFRESELLKNHRAASFSL